MKQRTEKLENIHITEEEQHIFTSVQFTDFAYKPIFVYKTNNTSSITYHYISKGIDPENNALTGVFDITIDVTTDETAAITLNTVKLLIPISQEHTSIEPIDEKDVMQFLKSYKPMLGQQKIPIGVILVELVKKFYIILSSFELPSNKYLVQVLPYTQYTW